MRTRWGILAAVAGAVAWENGVGGESGVRAERVCEARAALAAAPQAGTNDLRGMRVVLLADAKDHGPAGNGKHDYPLWQKRWALLLGGSAASEEMQVTLSGPPAGGAEDGRGAPAVRVETAWGWPEEEQFRTADAVVAFCYLNWTGERLARVRGYIEGGGGLVLVHSATWTKPKPSEAVAGVTGVGGFTLFRHGPVRLDVAARAHPIWLGLPEFVTLDDDETYWPPTPMMETAVVLATSIEDRGARGSTPRAAQPMLWCYEPGKGRVFGCVPGHCCATFDDPVFRILLLRGIAWAAGESPYRLDALALRGVSPAP